VTTDEPHFSGFEILSRRELALRVNVNIASVIAMSMRQPARFGLALAAQVKC
jgi:hypothetical protein